MERAQQISDVSGVLLLALLLAGCSGSQPLERYSRGREVGNQGGAWEVVLGSPTTPREDGWEYARLDGTMNIQTSVEQSEADNCRAGLDLIRRLSLNPRADQVLYFSLPRREHRGR